MSRVEELKKEFEISFNIFKTLSELSDNELRLKLLSILDGEYSHVLEENYRCVRTIVNSAPEKIEFNFYDKIIVDYRGVSVQPEHGSAFILVKFNKHFKV